MLESVEVVTAQIDVPARGILRLRVLLLIRHDDGLCVQRGKHLRILFPEKFQLVSLVDNICRFLDHLLEAHEIECPICTETAGEVLAQDTHLALVRLHFFISLTNLLDHIRLSFSLLMNFPGLTRARGMPCSLFSSRRRRPCSSPPRARAWRGRRRRSLRPACRRGS